MRLPAEIGAHLHLSTQFRPAAQTGISQSRPARGDFRRRDHSVRQLSGRRRRYGSAPELSGAGLRRGLQHDFLFNAIERVVAAVFPKTDSDPKAQPQRVQKPKAPSAGPAGDGPSGASGDGDGADEDGNGDKQGKQRKTSKKAAKSSAHPDATGQSGDQD
jgi:hypothetical protein